MKSNASHAEMLRGVVDRVLSAFGDLNALLLGQLDSSLGLLLSLVAKAFYGIPATRT